MEQEERDDNPNSEQGSNKFGLRDSDNARRKILIPASSQTAAAM